MRTGASRKNARNSLQISPARRSCPTCESAKSNAAPMTDRAALAASRLAGSIGFTRRM